MQNCSTHKKCYPSIEVAEDVLIEAHTTFNYSNNSGPQSVYKCDDCGHFHLTSRGPMNEKLSKYIGEGKIQRQKEANSWQDKLKKR